MGLESNPIFVLACVLVEEAKKALISGDAVSLDIIVLSIYCMVNHIIKIVFYKSLITVTLVFPATVSPVPAVQLASDASAWMVRGEAVLARAFTDVSHTVLGMRELTDVREVKRNVPVPILVTLSGMVMLVREVQ